MTNSVTLEAFNFQSIPHAKLKLQGFTCITGSSNLGKSAVIRALNGILFNEVHPNFIRHGAKETTLRLSFDPPTPISNISMVEFIKSDSKNIYNLSFPDGTATSFPKAGKDTPQLLKEAGFDRIVSAREDSFNLNIQDQIDPLFLVTATSTQFTSVLNTLFRIEHFEAALRNMIADNVKLNIEYNAKNTQLTDAEAQTNHQEIVLESVTKEFEQLQDIDKRHTALAQLHERLTFALEARARIAALQQEATTLQASIAETSAFKEQVVRLSALRTLQMILNIRANYQALLVNFNQAQQQVTEATLFRNQTSKLHLALQQLSQQTTAQAAISRTHQNLQQAQAVVNDALGFKGVAERTVTALNRLTKLSTYLRFKSNETILAANLVKAQTMFNQTEQVAKTLQRLEALRAARMKIDRTLLAYGFDQARYNENLEAQKHAQAFDVLLRTNMAECPLCHTKHVHAA